MIVRPTTVARWRRPGFWGWWRRRSRRRPGRPRIDSELQAVIRRMRTDNFLWGAPRIHGELLKLGITVSERTVSRYLAHRLVPPSQTWRTFLANHLGILMSRSALTADALGGDAIDAGCLRFAPLCRQSVGTCASNRGRFSTRRLRSSGPCLAGKRHRPTFTPLPARASAAAGIRHRCRAFVTRRQGARELLRPAPCVRTR